MKPVLNTSLLLVAMTVLLADCKKMIFFLSSSLTSKPLAFYQIQKNLILMGGYYKNINTNMTHKEGSQSRHGVLIFMIQTLLDTRFFGRIFMNTTPLAFW